MGQALSFHELRGLTRCPRAGGGNSPPAYTNVIQVPYSDLVWSNRRRMERSEIRVRSLDNDIVPPYSACAACRLLLGAEIAAYLPIRDMIGRIIRRPG